MTLTTLRTFTKLEQLAKLTQLARLVASCMSRRSHRRGQRSVCATLLCAAISATATAQTGATSAVPLGPGGATDSAALARASRVPVRQLGRVVASDTTTLMSVAAVRHLPGGGVIVNDATKRQLVVYDSTLAKGTVIADTSTNSPNSYGLRGFRGGMFAYIGDSTIFVDNESQAFLVIDPQGRFSRVMAPVKANDLFYLTSGAYGLAAFDPKGRLVYRTRRSQPPTAFKGPDPTGKPVISYDPDSAPLLRADFDERTIDTIGLIKAPLQKNVMQGNQNVMFFMQAINPLPIGDEWAMLPDGTIAIVRGQTYHIDWLSSEGKLTSSPRMPFAWRRITKEEKVVMIDSIKKEIADREAKAPPSPPPPPGMPAMPRIRQTPVEPEELPDYYPAVRLGQVFADREGNVWILPSTSRDARAGLLYDIVNRKGELVERVQLPKDRTLVGFGSSGEIYLTHVHSPTRASLERATVLRPPTP